MIRGTILKGIAGFYYVAAEDGNTYECKARGAFRKKGITPLAGDEVEISVIPEGVLKGSVDKILSRINVFERPPVANVEKLIIVCAAKNPAPNFRVIDKFAAAAELLNTSIVLCVNKCDIADAEILQQFKDIYEGVYPLYFVSAVTGEGIEGLRSEIKGSKIALAGPSGAGKSSLTNVLLGEEKSETGDISERLMRGKNTTRHSELFKAEGFSIFDTPGFTSFEAFDVEEQALAGLFPEFRNHLGGCRFSDCRHLKEPDCSIRAALAEGLISQSRYDSYADMMDGIENRKKY